MAAQAVDAQALALGGQGLANAAAGGNNRGVSSQSQSVRSKKVSVKTKKSRPKRMSKRTRQELSESEESRVVDSLNGSHIEQQAFRIPCREGCQLTFATLLKVDSHVKAVHAPPRVDEIFLNRRPLANQVITSNIATSNEPLSPTAINPSYCTPCHKFFATEADLIAHNSRHHSQSRVVVKCPISSCGVQFSDESSMLSHIFSSHKDQPNMVQAPQSHASLSLPNALSNLSLGNSQPSQQHLSSLSAPQSLFNQPGYSVPII